MTEVLLRTVGVLLKQEPDVALCDACLAFACSTSLIELRQVTECLVREDGQFQRGSACASCRRTVPTTCYRATTCARGSEPIRSDDTGVVVED